MTVNTEPTEAFPYKPPTARVRKKYAYIFELSEPLPTRLSKVIFDKFLALAVLTFVVPILLVLKLAYVIEGLLIPSNRGPMLFFLLGSESRKNDEKVETATN